MDVITVQRQKNMPNFLSFNFSLSRKYFSPKNTYFLETTGASQALELLIMGWVMILVPGGSSWLLSSSLARISISGWGGMACSSSCLSAPRKVARGVKEDPLPGLTVTEERCLEGWEGGPGRCLILVTLTALLDIVKGCLPGRHWQS